MYSREMLAKRILMLALLFVMIGGSGSSYAFQSQGTVPHRGLDGGQTGDGAFQRPHPM